MIWLDIPGYEGLYQASDKGQIRSLDRNIIRTNRWGNPSVFSLKGRLVRPWTNKKGYVYICLGAGKTNKKELHYWIATTFIGPRPFATAEVNHKNGIKNDNRISNLEWVTRQQNVRHSFDFGFNHKGSKHGIAKLNESQVLEIKQILKSKNKRAKPYYKDIATQFNVDRKTIESIAKGNTWGHIK